MSACTTNAGCLVCFGSFVRCCGISSCFHHDAFQWACCITLKSEQLFAFVLRIIKLILQLDHSIIHCQVYSSQILLFGLQLSLQLNVIIIFGAKLAAQLTQPSILGGELLLKALSLDSSFCELLVLECFLSYGLGGLQMAVVLILCHQYFCIPCSDAVPDACRCLAPKADRNSKCVRLIADWVNSRHGASTKATMIQHAPGSCLQQDERKQH